MRRVTGMERTGRVGLVSRGISRVSRAPFASLAALALVSLGALPALRAQGVAAAGAGTTGSATTVALVPMIYKPTPGYDPTSMDTAVDPCQDFYKFACGNFARNHPIPADEPSVNAFQQLYNVNTQSLRGILEKAAAGGPERSANEQKIGDYYKSCMDTGLIERQGLTPIQPLLAKIDAVNDLQGIGTLIGELQRVSVDVFFGYGEQQDFKDASKQIASADQGGMGLPEKDYYLRTDPKSKETQQQYVEHIAKMLVLGGEAAERAKADAAAIMAFETALARASMGVTERRDPANIYHLQSRQAFVATVSEEEWDRFEAAIHSPRVSELNDVNPAFFPALHALLRSTDVRTLQAYMRFHLLTAFASRLPKAIEDEDFDFFGHKLYGQPEEEPRWKRCANAADTAMGEALGQIYVQQYFPGDSKQKMLQMVHDIEAAMAGDIESLDWMSAETKVRARQKLDAVANKIGYPDKWRDYSALTIKPDDPIGNSLRSRRFENDRQLGKIGKPVDHGEWGMTPPTVNAYYDPSMNDINFPAGILQPAFYDPSQDDATNYGHIGAVIGHELTHGFDDQGRKFDPKGNLSDWWTQADSKNYEARSECLVEEYGGFTAVDDVKVNGKLTLGENTADNGGLVLAYIAYLSHARKSGVDLNAKIHGYTAPQRFYIGYAQNWCENQRDEAVRVGAQTDAHAPGHFRVNGPIVNQPGFAGAFSCKAGTPMVPAKSCRIW
ncbi:MAG TPA: M13 family metallopeptidase [Acidisarcina sp.]